MTQAQPIEFSEARDCVAAASRSIEGLTFQWSELRG
jgi:hypothetical protein